MIDIFEIKPATIEDVPLILSFIKELAEYERFWKFWGQVAPWPTLERS
jgi:hypothetical protein